MANKTKKSLKVRRNPNHFQTGGGLGQSLGSILSGANLFNTSLETVAPFTGFSNPNEPMYGQAGAAFGDIFSGITNDPAFAQKDLNLITNERLNKIKKEKKLVLAGSDAKGPIYRDPQGKLYTDRDLRGMLGENRAADVQFNKQLPMAQAVAGMMEIGRLSADSAKHTKTTASDVEFSSASPWPAGFAAKQGGKVINAGWLNNIFNTYKEQGGIVYQEGGDVDVEAYKAQMERYAAEKKLMDIQNRVSNIIDFYNNKPSRKQPKYSDNQQEYQQIQLANPEELSVYGLAEGQRMVYQDPNKNYRYVTDEEIPIDYSSFIQNLNQMSENNKASNQNFINKMSEYTKSDMYQKALEEELQMSEKEKKDLYKTIEELTAWENATKGSGASTVTQQNQQNTNNSQTPQETKMQGGIIKNKIRRYQDGGNTNLDDVIDYIYGIETSYGSGTGGTLSNVGYNAPKGYVDINANIKGAPPLFVKKGTKRREDGNYRKEDLYKGTGQFSGIRNKDEFKKLFLEEYGPDLMKIPAHLRKSAGDFLYNTGKDYRIYLLDEYLKRKGLGGIKDRPRFNKDTYNPTEWTPELKNEFEALWNQHKDKIEKLPEEVQRDLLRGGKDSYYRKILVKPDGSPNDAYYNSWSRRAKADAETPNVNGTKITINPNSPAYKNASNNPYDLSQKSSYLDQYDESVPVIESQKSTQSTASANSTNSTAAPSQQGVRVEIPITSDNPYGYNPSTGSGVQLGTPIQTSATSPNTSAGASTQTNTTVDKDNPYGYDPILGRSTQVDTPIIKRIKPDQVKDIYNIKGDKTWEYSKDADGNWITRRKGSDSDWVVISQSNLTKDKVKEADDILNSSAYMLKNKMQGGYANGVNSYEDGGRAMLGYKDISPYKNMPYQTFNTDTLTMRGVSIPILAIADTGQKTLMKPNSGTYKFPGAESIMEVPLAQNGMRVKSKSYFNNDGIERYQNGKYIKTFPGNIKINLDNSMPSISEDYLEMRFQAEEAAKRDPGFNMPGKTTSGSTNFSSPILDKITERSAKIKAYEDKMYEEYKQRRLKQNESKTYKSTSLSENPVFNDFLRNTDKSVPEDVVIGMGFSKYMNMSSDPYKSQMTSMYSVDGIPMSIHPNGQHLNYIQNARQGGKIRPLAYAQNSVYIPSSSNQESTLSYDQMPTNYYDAESVIPVVGFRNSARYAYQNTPKEEKYVPKVVVMEAPSSYDVDSNPPVIGLRSSASSAYRNAPKEEVKGTTSSISKPPATPPIASTAVNTDNPYGFDPITGRAVEIGTPIVKRVNPSEVKDIYNIKGDKTWEYAKDSNGNWITRRKGSNSDWVVISQSKLTQDKVKQANDILNSSAYMLKNKMQGGAITFRQGGPTYIVNGNKISPEEYRTGAYMRPRYMQDGGLTAPPMPMTEEEAMAMQQQGQGQPMMSPEQAPMAYGQGQPMPMTEEEAMAMQQQGQGQLMPMTEEGGASDEDVNREVLDLAVSFSEMNGITEEEALEALYNYPGEDNPLFTITSDEESLRKEVRKAVQIISEMTKKARKPQDERVMKKQQSLDKLAELTGNDPMQNIAIPKMGMSGMPPTDMDMAGAAPGMMKRGGWIRQYKDGGWVRKYKHGGKVLAYTNNFRKNLAVGNQDSPKGVIYSDSLVPIQTEKGELILTPTGDVVPVNAKKRHSQVSEDLVTDMAPENSYIFSKYGDVRIHKKLADEITIGIQNKPYNTFGRNPEPKTTTLGDFMNKKVMVPADVVKNVINKYRVIDNEGDLFTEETNRQNKLNRAGILDAIVNLSEIDKSMRGIDDTAPVPFKEGGYNVRNVPKAVWGLIAGAAAGPIASTIANFANRREVNRLERRNTADINELAATRKDYANKGLAANLAGMALQDTTVQAPTLSSTWLDQMKTKLARQNMDYNTSRLYSNRPNLSGYSPQMAALLSDRFYANAQNAQSDYAINAAMQEQGMLNRFLEGKQKYLDLNTTNRINALNATTANANRTLSGMSSAVSGNMADLSNLEAQRVSGTIAARNLGAQGRMASNMQFAQSVSDLAGGLASAGVLGKTPGSNLGSVSGGTNTYGPAYSGGPSWSIPNFNVTSGNQGIYDYFRQSQNPTGFNFMDTSTWGRGG